MTTAMLMAKNVSTFLTQMETGVMPVALCTFGNGGQLQFGLPADVPQLSPALLPLPDISGAAQFERLDGHAPAVLKGAQDLLLPHAERVIKEMTGLGSKTDALRRAAERYFFEGERGIEGVLSQERQFRAEARRLKLSPLKKDDKARRELGEKFDAAMSFFASAIMFARLNENLRAMDALMGADRAIGRIAYPHGVEDRRFCTIERWIVQNILTESAAALYDRALETGQVVANGPEMEDKEYHLQRGSAVIGWDCLFEETKEPYYEYRALMLGDWNYSLLGKLSRCFEERGDYLEAAFWNMRDAWRVFAGQGGWDTAGRLLREAARLFKKAGTDEAREVRTWAKEVSRRAKQWKVLDSDALPPEDLVFNDPGGRVVNARQNALRAQQRIKEFLAARNLRGGRRTTMREKDIDGGSPERFQTAGFTASCIVGWTIRCVDPQAEIPDDSVAALLDREYWTGLFTNLAPDLFGKVRHQLGECRRALIISLAAQVRFRNPGDLSDYLAVERGLDMLIEIITEALKAPL